MCLLRSRVRSPSSADGRFAGKVSGEAEVEEPADLSDVRTRERVPGVKRSLRCLSHRVSAGPLMARTPVPIGVLGEGFVSYVEIHHHQARRRRERSARSVLRDRACGCRVGRGPTTTVCDRVAKCESGGNWKINTGNGSRCLANLQPTCGTDQGERRCVPERDAGNQPWIVYNQEGERLNEEDRQEGGSQEVQCKC
jgi:Transglycosylase-like domain